MGATLAKRRIRRTALVLPRHEDAPASARHALEQTWHPLGPEGEYTAKLLLSELVTNAVKYGGDGPVRVEIESSDEGLRVEVVDDGRGFEPNRAREPEEVGGWGFVLVETLASSWGSAEGCSRVWFEIEARAA